MFTTFRYFYVLTRAILVLTSVTMIAVLLQLLAAYWEPWHNLNSLFRHFQAYPAGLFTNIQPYSGISRVLKHIQVHSGLIDAYEAIIRHIFAALRNPCIKPCHTQNTGIFKTQDIFKSLSSKMYDNYAYSELWHRKDYCVYLWV